MRDRRTRGLILAALLATSWGAAPAEEARPKRKDSPRVLQPREVTFTTAISPAKARPGSTVTYTVTAKIAAPWHIYAWAPAPPKEPGPAPTQFELFDLGGLKTDGVWTASREPHRIKEPAFGNLAFVEFFEKEVSWSTKLRVPADAAPGPHTVRNQVTFMICDPRSCKPAARVTLPPATVTVQGGGGGGGMAALIGGLTIAAEPAAPGPPDIPPPPSPPPARPAAPAGSAQEAIDAGFGTFLAFSALGGLFAFLMPCVWPMIPVTVNFFVKQGHARKGAATGLAVTYCLAIIGIFTLVGLLAALLMGPTGATRLGSNPWLNLMAAGIFILFGLSLLGLFEVRLPNFLLNASAQGESRGGLVGVAFMALTLTITSFTCTFPVVGALLVMATKGQYFYPVVGMLTFSTVLALPFFVLALAPGLMHRLPRSGDWMNAVKVVGGLIEIGAAFKFVNTAEVGFGTTPENAWFDAQVVLTIWIVTSLVAGIYLLGLFRTDHDHDEVRVGPVRLLGGVLFLALSLYLSPALFGFPPKSKIYDRIVGILPADSDQLDASAQLAQALGGAPPPAITTTTVVAAPTEVADRPPAAPAPPPQAQAPAQALRPVRATSTKPEEAIRQEKRVHGVLWGMSLDAALEEAKARHRPVLIDFTGVNCANCRTMERSVMPRPDVVEQLRKFVTVQLYIDIVDINSLDADLRKDLAEENGVKEVELVNQNSSPYYVVLSPDGKVLAQTGFDASPQGFATFLKQALAAFDGARVARAEGGSAGRE